jgi:Macrocin-O-methyltransferase (TylF)
MSVPSPVEPSDCVFDEKHYSATFRRKLIRSFQLGPKYYLWDLPRYFAFRHSVGLTVWDCATLLNPLREFSGRIYQQWELPPGHQAALDRLHRAGVRIALPRARLLGVLGVWWACRSRPGDVIECGSYEGATGLLLALLGRENSLNQVCHLLDTFSGSPAPSRFDGARSAGEFAQTADQSVILRQQAEILGVADRVKIHKGLFSETFAKLREQAQRYAFAHIDANIYASTLEACEFVLPRMNEGGAIVFDDYNSMCDLGARLAIDRYFHNRPERLKHLAGCSAYVSIRS